MICNNVILCYFRENQKPKGEKMKINQKPKGEKMKINQNRNKFLEKGPIHQFSQGTKKGKKGYNRKNKSWKKDLQ